MGKLPEIPGVTPEELYLRQSGLCSLVDIYDTIDGEEVHAGLQCHYRGWYENTTGLLNPTNECIRCIVSYFENIIGDYMTELGMNKHIVALIQSIFTSKKKEVFLSEETFNWLDEYISTNTLYSELTRPIKVAADGEIYMFGSAVHFDNDISFGLVKVDDNLVKVL